jgi:RNA polymerase-binding transcription factor DksA
MVVTTPRFTAKTERQLVQRLLARHAALCHSAESLRLEAAEANRGRDVSDMLDHEDPSADADTPTILILAEQAEGLLREAEEALRRAASGTYGYCLECGRGIPLARLRALPAAATCVDCSRSLSAPASRAGSSTSSGPQSLERRLLAESDTAAREVLR